MNDGDTVTGEALRQKIDKSMSEKEFMAQVVELAGGLGWMVYHTYDSRRSSKGFPDLVLAKPERFRLIFMEVKSEKGRVKPEQLAWLNVLNKCGALAMIVRPSAWDKIVEVLS